MTAEEKEVVWVKKQSDLRIQVAQALGWKFRTRDDEPIECWHDPEGCPAFGFAIPKYSSSLDPWRELFAAPDFPRSGFLDALEDMGIASRAALLRAHPVVLCRAYLMARGLPHE